MQNMIGNMARKQTGAMPSNGGGDFNPGTEYKFNNDTPWANPTFAGTLYNPMGREYHVGDEAYGTNSNGYQVQGRYMNGPNGVGIYRYDTPEVQARAAQQYLAKKFRADMPNMGNQLGHDLAAATQGQMDREMQALHQSNSHRGMLYGGVNAGQEGSLRAGAASSVAQGRSDINSGLMSQADQLDQQAIKTGLDIQKQQQSMQNAIYQQALSKMMAQQQMYSGIGQALGAAGGAYLGMGMGPAGAMVGAQAGAQAGKAVV